MKKALDVSTKGWSEEAIAKLSTSVNERNYRWKAHILQNGKKKYAYFYSKVDLEILAEQQGFTILKVIKL